MIDRPLVLISQIQRSGGTLLSQLLDGHPECLAYPHELKVGRPKKWDWPDLPMDAAPDAWLDFLFDEHLSRMAQTGYTKPGANPYAREHLLPFSFDAEGFRTRFLEACQQPPVWSQRDVLNRYFSAFFHTWADRSGTGRERCIAAFTPRVQMMPASLERYRRDYPDGRMISVIRDPLTWFASASRHDRARYADVDRAMDLWRASAEASMRLEATSPGAALVLLFEDLVRRPMLVMRRVAHFLRIAWHDCLLRPTYCGHLMFANSSFPTPNAGLTVEPLNRPLDLSPAERSYIAETAEPFYRACAARVRAAVPVAFNPA